MEAVVKTGRQRGVRVPVLMPASLVRELDTLIGQQEMANRAAAVREAVREYVRRHSGSHVA